MASDIIIEIDSKYGKHWVIVAEPEEVQSNGGVQHNGVWKLYVEGDDHLYIGDIAFHEEGTDWVYTGADLDDDEQEQVAAYIQSHLNDGESEPTFYVQAYYKGGMASFEIVPNEGHFAVAYDGEIIAEIQHNEDWEQTSGEELDEDVFDTIVQAIESHYE